MKSCKIDDKRLRKKYFFHRNEFETKSERKSTDGKIIPLISTSVILFYTLFLISTNIEFFVY